MQTTLTRAEIEAHDPTGGKGGRWLCPLPACAEHTGRNHRNLHLESSGVWTCHRCKAGGQLKDYWKDFVPESPRVKAQRVRLRRDAETSRKLEEIGARFRNAGKPFSAAGLALLGASGQAPVAGEGLNLHSVIAPADSGSTRTVHPELKEVLYRAGSLQGFDQAREFIALRGFADFPDALTRARVRFAPDFGRREAAQEKGAYQGAPALVFPISDDAGELVAFQGRKVAPGDGLKVLTFGPKTSGVFWGPRSLESFHAGQAVAICEAPLDALTLSLCDVPAVALCGSSHLPEFLRRGCFGRRYWLAFDADKAGDDAAQVIGSELRGLGAIVERLRPFDVKDWNEALQMGGEVWDREAEEVKRRTAAALLPFLGSEAKAPTEPTKALETPVKAPSLNYVKPKSKLSLLGELDQVGSKSPLQALQLRQVATKSASELGEVGRESPLAEALYPAGDSRQEVLCWAVSEAKKAALPELAEPLLLPSGQVVQADGVKAWLLTGHDRALRLALVAAGDAPAALVILRQDLRALALWAAHARVWLDTPSHARG